MDGRTISNRTSQVPQNTNSYEPFVREVLTRLSHDLVAGRLSIRQESDGVSAVRYIVDAPGHAGRSIIVPASADALQSPTDLPERSPRGLLSKLRVVDSDGKAVHVPKSAIVRDHKQRFLNCHRMLGACRGCEFGTCPHGWIDPHPASIVVLKLRNRSGFDAFGWYVRFNDAPTDLVRVPTQIIKRIAPEFENDDVMQNSRLVTQYEDCVTTMDWDDDDDTSFHKTACERFALFRKRAAVAAAKDKKRKRLEQEESSEGGETCVICLEERASAQKRCRHVNCGTHVCDACHSNSRGLCPVCDRPSINADYPCSSCHRLTRLSCYGYPCTACDSHSLCVRCYGEFGACGACSVE